jgi:hypothetical protein
VIDSLSFRMFGPSSSLSVIGSLQERPPSSDFETRIALSGRPPAAVMPPLAERLIAWRSPFGAKECQGSEARTQSGFPPHVLKGSVTCVQLPPPFVLTPATRPRAPPFDQRSCCHVATMFSGSVGLTSTHGSTSVFG